MTTPAMAPESLNRLGAPKAEGAAKNTAAKASGNIGLFGLVLDISNAWTGGQAPAII